MNSYKCNYSLLLSSKIPDDLFPLIFSFLPTSALMWLNKEFYFKYHKQVRSTIPKHLYTNYIRDIVRNDLSFVFDLILNENKIKWGLNKEIIYKKNKHKNFFSFLNAFCIENKSNKCRDLFLEYISKANLSKNQHKKNNYVNIRWRI